MTRECTVFPVKFEYTLSQQCQCAAAARLLQSASVAPLVMAFICII